LEGFDYLHSSFRKADTETGSSALMHETFLKVFMRDILTEKPKSGIKKYRKYRHSNKNNYILLF